MNQNLNTSEGVRDFMAASTSESDWNSRIDKVKAANGGDYPPFWYPTIIMSNLHSRTAAKWGGNGNITVTDIS